VRTTVGPPVVRTPGYRSELERLGGAACVPPPRRRIVLERAAPAGLSEPARRGSVTIRSTHRAPRSSVQPITAGAPVGNVGSQVEFSGGEFTLIFERGVVDSISMKVLSLRRPGTCVTCSIALPVGTRAAWHAAARTVQCLACAEEMSAHPVTQAVDNTATSAVAIPRQQNVAGVSAQRQYEKRSQRREAQIRARHPKLGGVILALTNEPPSTRVWAQGAEGERAVGAKLAELVGEHVEVLHDRAMRRADGHLSTANIDHIAVVASGVWVIDAKTHRGKLEVRRTGGLFSPRVERLYIAGRDKTTLLVGLAKQVTAVTAELASAYPAVPVDGALCFVGTELPWLGESIGGVPLVGRRGLAKLLNRSGDLSGEDRVAIAEFLGGRFPTAR
jgi:nuclease-like protein